MTHRGPDEQGHVDVMIGPLDRLLAVMSLARVSYGIIPARANYVVPTNQDDAESPAAE